MSAGEREGNAPESGELRPEDPRYRRAARLLAQKLGTSWRDLPPDQVREYARKIEVAREHQGEPPLKSDA